MNKFIRSNRHKTVAALLLPLVTIFILGGCSSSPEDKPIEVQAQSFDALRDTATAVISDPERANEAVGLITQFEDIIIKTQIDRAEHRARIKALNADYDATETEFTTLLANINEEQDANREIAVDIRRKLALAVPASEWSRLVKALDDTRGESFSTLQTAN